MSNNSSIITQLAVDLVQYAEDFYEYDFYDTLSEHNNDKQELIDITEHDIVDDKQEVLNRLLQDKQDMSVDNENDQELYNRLCVLITRLENL